MTKWYFIFYDWISFHFHRFWNYLIKNFIAQCTFSSVFQSCHPFCVREDAVFLASCHFDITNTHPREELFFCFGFWVYFYPKVFCGFFHVSRHSESYPPMHPKQNYSVCNGMSIHLTSIMGALGIFVSAKIHDNPIRCIVWISCILAGRSSQVSLPTKSQDWSVFWLDMFNMICCVLEWIRDFRILNQGGIDDNLILCNQLIWFRIKSTDPLFNLWLG